MDKLHDLASIWKRGFLLLILLAIALATGALICLLLLAGLDAVLDLGQDAMLRWLLILAPIWAPIWAGFVARDAYRLFPADAVAPGREWRANSVKSLSRQLRGEGAIS